MYFTSNRKEVTADDDMLNPVLGQNVIKCVKETKFLGVIIDDEFSWDTHAWQNLKPVKGLGHFKVEF